MRNGVWSDLHGEKGSDDDALSSCQSQESRATTHNAITGTIDPRTYSRLRRDLLTDGLRERDETMTNTVFMTHARGGGRRVYFSLFFFVPFT